MTIIPADGPEPCDLMVVGERPGPEDAKAAAEGLERCNMVGIDGSALFLRLWQATGYERGECRVAMCVPVYGDGLATPRELTEHRWRLHRELRRTRPMVVLAVGEAAARELARIRVGPGPLDRPFTVIYGRLEPGYAIVVPVPVDDEPQKASLLTVRRVLHGDWFRKRNLKPVPVPVPVPKGRKAVPVPLPLE